MGARVLSSQGVSTPEEVPVPGPSSKENESPPPPAGGRLIEGSKNPWGGGGKKAESIGLILDC
jgi:hypothetical protein